MLVVLLFRPALAPELAAVPAQPRLLRLLNFQAPAIAPADDAAGGQQHGQDDRTRPAAHGVKGDAVAPAAPISSAVPVR